MHSRIFAFATPLCNCLRKYSIPPYCIFKWAYSFPAISRDNEYENLLICNNITN